MISVSGGWYQWVVVGVVLLLVVRNDPSVFFERQAKSAERKIWSTGSHNVGLIQRTKAKTSRTSSSVRLWWEFEEPKGPKGMGGEMFAALPMTTKLSGKIEEVITRRWVVLRDTGVYPSSGSIVISRRARLGLAGLGSHSCSEVGRVRRWVVLRGTWVYPCFFARSACGEAPEKTFFSTPASKSQHCQAGVPKTESWTILKARFTEGLPAA